MAKRFLENLKIIQLLVADTLSEPNNIEFAELVAFLPLDLQVKARRYKNKRSAINYCFGRLMLMQAISDVGLGASKISQLRYSDNDKPFIEGFSFSISHSENLVILAYSRDCRLGIDIEKIQKVELKNFKSFFREEEWTAINSASEPLEKFYWYWVRKESILKAEDAKMNQVNDIFITSPAHGYFKNPKNSWQLQEVSIAENYASVLAFDAKDAEISLSTFILKI